MDTAGPRSPNTRTRLYPTQRLRRGDLADYISIVAFEAGYVLNRAGSIAVGFELSLPEKKMTAMIISPTTVTKLARLSWPSTKVFANT